MHAEANVRAAAVLGVLRRIERLICVVAFAVLVAVMFADVLSRELTSAGLYWAPQIGVWANVFVVMAGFGLASADGAQLRPRFADGWLPERWNGALGFLQHAFMAVFCVGIGALSLKVVFGTWQLGEVSIDLFLPLWPVQAMLPAAFLAASVRHGIYAVFPALRPGERGAFGAGLPAE